uniref:Uncharacterized protein n=1 Tax=Corethron hystrix TaxID=216773 RepID=A0A7S1FWI5_9STRA
MTSSKGTVKSWADSTWGLGCGRHTIGEALPQPFQCTIFMTPDRFCNVNVGVDDVGGTPQNLAVIWMLLDYFGLYFKEDGYGNPFFQVNDAKEKSKAELKRYIVSEDDSEYKWMDQRREKTRKVTTV